MPAALIDLTVVQTILLKALRYAVDTDQADPRIRVLASHEPPPSPQDQHPHNRWCRLQPMLFGDSSRVNAAGHNDKRDFSNLITVGVSDETMSSTPYALTNTVMIIAAALDSIAMQHPTTTHSLQVETVRPEPRQSGEHALHLTAVLTVTGSVQRVDGRTMLLTVS